MKKTIEIEDNLQEIVDMTIGEVKDELLNWLKENHDCNYEKNDAGEWEGCEPEAPDMGNDLDYSGRIHEIIDGSVPIYTHEITDIFYLHGDDVEQAFDDAGIGEKKDGDGWPMGWKAAAVYCYIDEAVNNWYHENAENVCQEWFECEHPDAKAKK